MYQFWYRLPNLRVKKSSLVQTINTFTNSGFSNYFGLWVLVITHTLKTINRVNGRIKSDLSPSFHLLIVSLEEFQVNLRSNINLSSSFNCRE